MQIPYPRTIIIEETEELIVVNKPSGVLVQSDLTQDDDILTVMCNYLDKELFLVNRIDRPVSGVAILAKNKKVVAALQKTWKTETSKIYYAITEGKWKVESGRLSHRLLKTKANKARESDIGKEAILDYKVIYNYERYSLVEIKLITGRFHQIRAQLSLSGHPIKGDVKYGARRKNKDRSIYLHCGKISTSKYGTFVAKFPPEDSLWGIAEDYIYK